MKEITTIEQSKELAKILKIETADCAWMCLASEPILSSKPFKEYVEELPCHDWLVPAWSLGALIELFADDFNQPYKGLILEIHQLQGRSWVFKCWYKQGLFTTATHDTPIKACVQLIRNLKALKEI